METMKDKLQRLFGAALIALVAVAVFAGIAALGWWYYHCATWWTNLLLFAIATGFIYYEIGRPLPSLNDADEYND